MGHYEIERLKKQSNDSILALKGQELCFVFLFILHFSIHHTDIDFSFQFAHETSNPTCFS